MHPIFFLKKNYFMEIEYPLEPGEIAWFYFCRWRIKKNLRHIQKCFREVAA